MGISKRIERLEQTIGSRGECGCKPRTRVILPEEEHTDEEPETGTCETCGGAFEVTVIKLVWMEGGKQ
jgi:hypothetical protein